ncbi:MAG: helix-turn-helix transcriptional regulator [Clostridiales bacterium]|nr:helix-turn-helix transcriptional regulator [Clostridiales bacterium]
MYNFQKHFNELKEKAGLTNYRIAKDLGVDRVQLLRWARGGVEPKPEWLYKIASYFEVPMETFFTDEPKMNYTATTGRYTSIVEGLRRLGYLDFHDIDDDRIEVEFNGEQLGIWSVYHQTFVD